MDKKFMPSLSIEEFAAYLDGNLSEDEMNRIDALVTTNPDMKELVDIADEVDEDVQIYLQDEFAYEADITAMEDSGFDIPNLDSDIISLVGDDSAEHKEVTCAACAVEEMSDVDELFSNKTYNDMNDNSGFPTPQNGNIINTFIEDNGDNTPDTSDILLDDDFLSF